MIRVLVTSIVVSTLLIAPVRADTVAEQIMAHLIDQAPSDVLNARVQIGANHRHLGKRSCISVTSIRSPQPIRWPGRGLIEILCDGSKKTVLPVSTDYDLIAWQASDAIGRGIILTKDRVISKLVSASRAPHNLITRESDWQGKQTRRLITGGAIIKLSDLEEPIAIKRGQRISLIAKFGKVEATMIATAMQDGRIGESVNVKIANSQRVLQGIVLDSGTVAVNSRTKRMGTIAKE